MRTGRPTLYNEDMVKKAEEYLLNLPNDEVVHSIEGLADYLNISRETIYDWSRQENKHIFSDIVKSVLIKQGKTLINKSLKREFEPRITGMMLSKHGYAVKNETDITTKGEKLPNAVVVESRVEQILEEDDQSSET